MKRVIPILFCVTLLLSACTMTPATTPPSELPGGWALVWSDEFDGPAGAAPDPAKWNYDLGGHGWGNQEWEYYTDSPENAALDGTGNLVITARAMDNPDASDLDCWYGPCKFTSARLLTQDKFDFTYGRVEARLKIPFGQGIWPAFWMLGNDIPGAGWPACGEIDIMENIGREPGIVHGTLHGPGFYGADGISSAYSLPDGAAFSADFHVYAIEWEADEVRWYVDGNLYGTVRKSQFSETQRWVFDHPFFIILNVAVGGGWPGYPDATSAFPQTMLVDYVRVYQKP
ncbi:MAG: glycoside hydrolase family 16 protein [Chloroflexi bacterium]|nr:glycoside hydrolase family 16 protein [Chloroflexota bacterium]